MIGRLVSPPQAEPAKLKGFDDFDLRLGDVMRGERATLGKSLLDVQRELKIKATYIAAIENTDPTAFETPGFIAGYVRSYARYLGLDPEWAYQTFCEEGQFQTAHGMSAQASKVGPASGGKPARRAKSSEIRDPLGDPNALFVPRGETTWLHIEPSAIGSILVLVALIGGLGYGGWSVLQEVQRVQFAPVDQAPGVTSNVDPLGTGNIIAAAADQGPGVEAPNPDALDRLYRPQALDVPVLVARDGPIAAVDPRTFGTLVDEGAATRTAGVAPEPAALDAPAADDIAPVRVLAADAPDVVVFATQPAWIRISAADGSVIFEKILDAGEEYVLPKTDEPPLLRTGYAGAVYFAVNGAAYGPAGDGAAVVKNIVMDQSELKETYALADLEANPALAKVVAELTLTAAE